MSHLMDPDEFVSCPYDASHRVQVHRLQMHLIKCKKSHPELSRAFVTCPFNALHLYYPNEIQQHMSECKDADRLVNRSHHSSVIRGNTSVPTYSNNIVNHDTEDWDEEDNTPVSASVREEPPKKFVDEEKNQFKRPGLGRGLLLKSKLTSEKDVYAQMWKDA